MTRLPMTVGLLAGAFATFLPAQDTVSVKGTVKAADFSNRENPPPVMPMSDGAELKPATGAQPSWCVDGVAGKWTVRGKEIAVIVGKSKAESATPDVLGVDLDGNGKIDDGEHLPLAVREQTARDTKMLIGTAVDCTLHVGGADLPAKVGFMKRGDSATASLQFPNYLEASVKLGDAEQKVAILDKDQDGKYGTAGDLWTLQPSDAKQPTSAYGLSAMGERRFLTDKLVGITVKGDTIDVTSTAAKGPDAKDSAAHRARVEHMWKERFDKDRAEFYKARGLDESRPLATTPIQWHYVSFDEGLALAKQSGKPLFVDVMAFWCVWCYRMDYTTYPDKEVADLLNNSFIPVKIIQEQDLANDYKGMMEKLEARGIPAMGIFDAAGKKLHSIGGWKKPDEFVAELKKGLEAAGTK